MSCMHDPRCPGCSVCAPELQRYVAGCNCEIYETCAKCADPCQAPDAGYDCHGVVAPHAAEVLGELASYRADIAALRALLNVTLDNRIEEMDGRIRTIEHKLNLI